MGFWVVESRPKGKRGKGQKWVPCIEKPGPSYIKSVAEKDAEAWASATPRYEYRVRPYKRASR